MGCDIHLYVERQRADGVWEFCPSPGSLLARGHLVELYGGGTEAQQAVDAVISLQTLEESDDFYDGRDYSLFGILADVRTREHPPLAQPRGVPDDASPEYLKRVDDYGSDGHSHSWFLLSELLAHKWSHDHRYFVNTTLTFMKRGGDPTKIRAVFFFDN